MKRTTLGSTFGVIFILSIFIIGIGHSQGDYDICPECYNSDMAVRFYFIGLLIIGMGIHSKREYLKTEEIIFDIESEPILHTDEATEGLQFAGEGIVESGDGQLQSPYTHTPCVYYHSITEKVGSKKGLRGDVKSANWRTTENISKSVPFYLKDDNGKLKIDITGITNDFSSFSMFKNSVEDNLSTNQESEIDSIPILKDEEYSESESSILKTSDPIKYRRSEYVLSLDAKIFVYGKVKNINDELILQEDKSSPLIISRKNHDEYINDFYKGGNLIYLAPLLMSIGYTIFLLSLNHFWQWKPDFLWLLFLAGNGIIAGNIFISFYNRIIVFRERAFNAESNIDGEIVRRSQLIPELVEVVKGYIKEESKIQQIISEMRSEKIFSREVTPKTVATLSALDMLFENYPDLKSATNFQALSRTITETEDRIAYSRKFYNHNVRKYNYIIRKFPYILFSLPLRMKEMEYLSFTAQGYTNI